MGNKLFLIALLCAALGLFLFIRPRLFPPDPTPTLMDRLPESEVLGRFYLLDVARETNAMLFYNKIPFRDLLSYDFILGQGKSFGLDIQKPGYFFADKTGEWGVFVHVSDSAKVPNGFARLRQFVEMKDTVILNRRVTKIPDQQLYLYYDKNYLFVYHGSKMKRRLSRAVYARFGETGKSWKRFNSLQTFSNEKLVVYSDSRKLRKYGIDYGLFAHDSDSASFKLKAYIHATQDLRIRMKDSGYALPPSSVAARALDLHLDISDFRNDKQHPLYKWITEMGKRISFPTEAFLQAWEGDLCFQQGGTQMVQEEVVETGYNDEFEMVEIRTTKMVPVPGFAVMVSVNEQSRNMINRLFAKGIMTRQGNYYRFLFSPPLHLNVKPDYISAYSSQRPPKIANGGQCSGLWDYRGTNVAFRIDSLKARDVYGSLEFPVQRLLRRNRFF